MAERPYRPFRPDDEMDAVARLMTKAFGGPEDSSRSYLARAADFVRVAAKGGDVTGGLALLPMGHYVGGRVVPAEGVAAVAIDPSARGGGLGTRLMRAAVEEMHERGTAISALYPAAQPIYRRAGYERAGHLYVVNADLNRIAPIDRSAVLREGREDDESSLERLEAERAAANDGNLARSAYMWRQAREPHGQPTYLHVVEEEGRITGYARVRYVHVEGKRRLAVSDLVASTPGAARRLLAFLADHASQIEKARWLGHPSDPLQMAADSLCFDVKVGDVWMLRIVHVENALAGRGYPRGLTTEVHLELEDDLCPANAGRWRLRIDDGAPTVERGGSGRVGMHVRDLAPIYTGYVHPLALGATRPLRGSTRDLEGLAAAFPRGAPWMQDAF
jgi:predicted acetyltransferase